MRLQREVTVDRSVAVNAYIQNDSAVKKCSAQELARLVAAIDLVSFDAEEVIYEPVDAATDVYYIVDGKVEVTTDGASKIIGNGHYFGQEAGFMASTYLEKARALEKSHVLKMPGPTFAHVMEGHSDVRSEILFSMFRGLQKLTPSGLSSGTSSHNFSTFSLINQIFGWLLCIVMPLVIFFATTEMVPSTSGRIYVSFLAAGLLMWICDLVDSFIVGIFLIVTALVLRLAPADIILSGYSSATFFMALGILGLGSILVNSGILYRLLLHILKRIPNTQFWSNVSVFLLGVVMTMAVPVALNRVEVITPFLNEFTSQTKVRTKSKSATKLAMSAIFSISLFSPIFLSGSLHNFMLLGLLWAQDQERFQWLGWLQAAAVPGVIILIGYAVPLFFVLRSEEDLAIDRSKIADQLKTLGPISRIEKFAMVCFAVFSIGMMTQSFHRLPPQLIGLFILFALLVLEILTRENFQSLINWPALFLLGSLIGLINFFNYLHLNDFIVDKLGWLGGYIKTDFYLFVLLLILVINVVRLFIPYGPAVVLLGTVFVPIAQQYEVNPWTVGFLILLIGKMWIYPTQYPPFIDFCRLASKEIVFDKKTILIYNSYMNVVKIAAIYLSIPYWKMLGVL